MLKNVDEYLESLEDQGLHPLEQMGIRRLADNGADMEELESYVKHIKLFGSPGLCFEKPHCTDLLNNPAEVFEDRNRWPLHLCYEDFLRVSTERWAMNFPLYADEKGVICSSHPRCKWHPLWPLPIGKGSATREIRAFGFHGREPMHELPELLNLVPFEGYEAAIWALRIERNGSTLDLFGLADYWTDLTGLEIEEDYIVAQDEADPFGSRVISVEKDDKGGHVATIEGVVDGAVDRVPTSDLMLHYSEAVIRNGRLAYILRGQDTDLIDLVHAAKRWWVGFSGQPVGRGRPRGVSGAFPSVDDFRHDMRLAMEGVRERGENITQEKVAGLLHCDVSTLKRWIGRAGFSSWEEAKAR